MALNTYPYSPFPASTEQLHKGDNEDLQAQIDSLESGLTTLDNEVNGDAVEYPYADVITIPDAVPANVADCNVKIEPVQSGSGDPSPTNVRPITGHTEASVQRVGKNLCDWKVDIATNALEIALKSGTYTISAKSELDSGNWYFRLSDANGEYPYTPTEFGNPDFIKAQSGWFYGQGHLQTITFIVPSGCSKVEIAKLNAE